MNWLLGKIVGNPAVLLWLLLAAFVAGGSAAWTVQGWRLDAVQSKFDGFVATVKAQGEAAEKLKVAKETEHNRITKEIKDAIPKQIAAARSNAVRNYIASLPVSPGGSGVSGTARGAGGVDAASKESVAAGWSGTADPAFIEDCAQDAALIGAWQDWARKNEFPTK